LMKFSYIILRINVMLSFNTGLLLILAHKTISSMKKLCLLLLPFFYIGPGYEIRVPGWTNTGTLIRIRYQFLYWLLLLGSFKRLF
jgi:hypothetical protein